MMRLLLAPLVLVAALIGLYAYARAQDYTITLWNGETS